MALELAETGKSFVPEFPGGLVGHWKMDEAAWTGAVDEVLDSSGYGHHGQAFNNATPGPGKVGNAGIFAAQDDHVRVPLTSSLKPTDELTHMALVRPQSGGNHFTVCASGAVTRGFSIYGAAGKFYFYCYIDTWRAIIADSPYSLGAWYHVAGTFKDGEQKLYINGTLQSLPGAHAGVLDYGASDKFCISARADGTAGSVADIDEVMIFNKALPQADISYISDCLMAGRAVGSPYALPLEAVDIRPELEVVEV